MSDRIVRQNILTSESINILSWAAEVFYRRLMSVADDFGRYDGRPDILRGSLYSLKLDTVSKSDIVKWMGECSKAGLVRLYSMDGREYLEILKFGQRLRAMRSKYPAPGNIGGQMSACGSTPPPETKGNETETETKLNPPTPHREMTQKDFTIFQSQLIQEQVFMEQIMMTRGVKDKLAMLNWIKVFNAHIAGESKTNKDYVDYKKHFKNWILKQNTSVAPEIIAQAGERKETAREKKDRELQKEIYGD